MANEKKEEIRKSIFILKSNPMALQGAENFLRSRGWDVFVSTTLQTAIPLILTKKPEYILLCANHPQKKVKQLPSVLAHSINLKLLVYVDIASTLNMSLMQGFGIPIQLLPPVSGPSIERAVFKYEKEVTTRNDNLKKFSESEFMGNYSISHVKPLAEVQNEINHFIDTANNDPDDGGYAISSESSPSSIESEKLLEDASKYETYSEYEERISKESGGNIKSFTPDPQNQHSQQYVIPIDKKPPNSSNNTIIKNTEKKIIRNSLYSDSIMVKGAQIALDSSVVKTSQKVEKIEKSSDSQNCLCIVIDATRFHGYLIAALGKNKRFDDEFVNSIHAKLFEFLKKQGENVDDENALEIKIKPVEFESWALEQAEFLKKSVHNGDEVAMAFFPSPKTAPEVTESAKEDMLAINIDDLEGDIQVLFDVYIYLPSNKRYILYTPKGGLFLANQKDRLKNKGIIQMHMKKESLTEAKKYQAQNFLNNKINEFEKKAETESKFKGKKSIA